MPEAAQEGTSDGADPKRWKSWRSRVAWLLVCTAYVGLGYAFFLPDLGDDGRIGNVLMWLAFVGRTFAFHAGIGLLLIAVWMAAFRLWRPLMAMVPLVAVSLGPTAISYVPELEYRELNGTTVMSVNLLVGSRSPTRAVQEIERLDPDMVLVQEYSTRAHEVMEPALREKYPHIVHAIRDDAFGQAVYSKLAFVEPPKTYPPPSLGEGWRKGGIINLSDPQIRVVVMIGGREVVVQNVHTIPPVSPSHLAEQRRLLRWLVEFAASESRPVIMGGDFNATDESLGMLHAAGLWNSHGAAGGRDVTWHDSGWASYLPGVRIDHIWVKGMDTEWWDRAASIGSDHRPIVAKVGWDPLK